MTARAQIQAATAEVALRLGMLGVPASRTLELCAVARKAGHRSRLDQLAAVLIAVGDRGGDVPNSAVKRGSPNHLRDRAAHLHAEVRRRCGPSGDWATQTRPERRRGVRQTWVEAQARDFAHRCWPGSGRNARAQRERWLRQIGAIAQKPGKRSKGAGGAA